MSDGTKFVVYLLTAWALASVAASALYITILWLLGGLR